MSKKRKVLIIEKDREFGELLALNFKAWGFQPEVIYSGAEALKKKTSDYKLITTEISVPIINGKTLLETFERLNNKTPVIVLTGIKDEKIKQDLIKLSFLAGWFNKPIDLHKLKNYVMELIFQDKADLTKFFNTRTSLNIDDTVNIKLLQRKIHGELNDLDETQVSFRPVEKSVIMRERDSMQMIRIPEGFAIIGSQDYDENERPVLRIFLRSFYIDKYPVTNGQYAKFLRWVARTRNPYVYSHPQQLRNKNFVPKFWDDERFNEDEHPVVGVDWFDAFAYSRWANNTQDYETLPTEFQWEYAARGNSDSDYPWGSDLPDADLANFGKIYGFTTPVSKFIEDKSPFGVHNMCGNVWEWCANWFVPDYYKKLSLSAKVLKGDEISEISEMKVLRGGSFINTAEQIRVSNRGSMKPTEKYFHIGFRCCAPVSLYK